MEEKTPRQNTPEEVDLGQLFNAISKLFSSLFSSIASLFKGLFSLLIYALKPFIKHFKLITIVLIIAAIAGYVTDKNKKPIYEANMLVKPYFDSKYQLTNTVGYLNTLIATKETQKLASFFEIDTTNASQLLSFELSIGPETKTELLEYYNDYIKTIDTYVKNVEGDSSRTAFFTYKEFVENRDLIDAELFKIEAKSHKADIFPDLEKGFIKIFKNSHSEKLKKRAHRAYLISKATYQKQLEHIDSLKQVYVEVLKNESKNNNITLGSNALYPLTKEKTQTREYDLFLEEIKIRNHLRYLEEEYLENSDYYDIVSNFGNVGSKEHSVLRTNIIIFPALALLIMVLLFLAYNTFQYIDSYNDK